MIYFNYLVALSPGIIGATLTATASFYIGGWARNAMLVFAGAGGMLGYLALAILISYRDQRGYVVFSIFDRNILFGVTAAIIVSCAIFVIKSRKKHCRSDWPFTISFAKPSHSTFMVVLILSFVVTVLYQAVNSPVFGWDSLGLWTEQAAWFLNFDIHGAEVYARTRSEGIPFPWEHPRHPMTLIYISAFSAFALEGEGAGGWMAPWSFVWACGLMVTISFSRCTIGDRALAYLPALLYLTLPLMANHAIAVGYAEMWVVVSVIVAAALIAMAIKFSDPYCMAIGVMMAIIPMLFKNTGVLYSTALLSPLLFYAIGSLSRPVASATVTLGFILTFVAFIFGFDFAVGGFRAAIIYGKEAEIIFGGYTYKFDFFPTYLILRNSFWAFFVNQSFSVLSLFLILMIGASWRLKSEQTLLKEAMMARYLLSAASFIVILFMLPQLSSDYANTFANPSSDLGNSRFVLPAASLLLLAFAPYLKMALFLEKQRNCGISN